jgi:Fe-S-cluster containining protein
MFDKKGLKIKAQQFFECLLPIDKSRVGECQNCGRCCQLGSKCIFFINNKCLIYKFRPLQCRKSPRTVKYLKKGCIGYKFVKE